MAVLFGLLAIILNVIVLVAIYHVRCRISTHYKLIINLAISDILVGGTVLLHIVNKVFNPTYEVGKGPYTARLKSRCLFIIIKALNNTGLNITLLSLMLMALDHYIAIIKPLQYPLITRKQRVVCTIFLAWALSLFLGFSDFLSAITEYSEWKPYDVNYCEVVWYTSYQEEYTTFAIAPICLGTMIYMYSCICIKVRRRQTPGRDEAVPHREPRRNIKAVITTLLTLGSFIIAWLPLCLFQITHIIKAYTDPEDLKQNQYILTMVDRYLFNFLAFNAIIDPVIYTVRMREVQAGFKRMCCACFPNWQPYKRHARNVTVTISCHPSTTHEKISTDIMLLDVKA